MITMKENSEDSIDILNLPNNIAQKLKNKGFLKIDEITKYTEKEFSAIEGIGKTTFDILKLALKVKKINFKKVEKVKDLNGPVYREIIKKFLGWKIDQISWGSELSIAKRIFAINKNVLNIELGFKINSLAFFLTFKGKEFLTKTPEPKKKESVREITVKPVELTEYKYGEDIIIEKRKSIRDFLNE